MILLSHPTGNQNVRHAALGLANHGLLYELWTSLNLDEHSWYCRWAPRRISQELRRRSFPPELKSFIRTRAFREVGRQFCGRFGWNPLVRNERAPFSLAAVYRDLDLQIARRIVRSDSTLKAIYAYDDGALASFRVAQSLGIHRIYELPVTYWRKVLEIQNEEADRHPEWACTLVGLKDTDDKLARKDEELALADLIIVPSLFSQESLSLAPSRKAPIKIIPYGAPAPVQCFEKLHPESAKIRVLFVGGLTQAKGLGYLLEAADRLKGHIELTMVGKRVHPSMPTAGMIRPWKWIPSLPHEQVLALMRRHDILVCPSLHEGLGLVLLEALSQGLPIIATYNSGAPDIITHGREGFLIPAGSTEGIVQNLETLLANPGLLLEMSFAARNRAADFSWQVYENRLVDTMRELLIQNDHRFTEYPR
jgi:glycosyltransferase involved in cell wall biosynthesis